jgi:hypothetical protein
MKIIGKRILVFIIINTLFFIGVYISGYQFSRSIFGLFVFCLWIIVQLISICIILEIEN